MRRQPEMLISGARAISLIAAFLILFICDISVAGKKDFKWDPITDSDWSVSEDPSREIVDAVMIFEKITVDDTRLLKDKHYISYYRRIRILSPDGRDQADVQISYVRKGYKIEEIRGRVILRNGQIVELENTQIIEGRLIKTRGTEIKQKSFSLAGVTGDCIMEYYFKLKLKSSSGIWQFQRSIALLHGEYLWLFFRGRGMSDNSYANFRKDWAPNYLWLNNDSKITITKLPSVTATEEILFTIDSVLPLKSEPYSLPDIARQAQLRCYYGAAGTSGSYWVDQINEIPEWLEEFFGKAKRYKELIDRLKRLKTNEEKIQEAYDWVQSTFRNTTYETFEKKIKKIKNADAAMKKGYASRGQLNYIFCGILRELGIDAQLAYVVDRDENLLVAEAKYWQFDRNLVGVADGLEFKFYSPGDMYLPSNQIPWYTEGISALVGGTIGQQFYSTKFSSSKSNKINRLISLDVDDDLLVSGTCSERLIGHPARRVRLYQNEESVEVTYESLEERLEDLFSNAEFDSIMTENVDSVSKPLLVTSKVSFESPLQMVGSRIFLRPIEYMSESSNPFESEKRESIILFRYAFDKTEALNFALPEGWETEALPGDTIFENVVGICGVTFNVIGGKLTIQRKFELRTPFLNAR
ncbi:MAG: DUF3857 domain-containing protein, partial [candidate division Zixibacteria bacterium]|nr:DUF3857 domain-containing protein [candidate division Zixibacteria bacterium]